ncbi:MAG TPA: hypothetical protein VNK52_15510 [Hyphomicrobiaceae bacterium]|nr:hypothetical protein [Hyphomicrobiaceae bacterium]
MTPVRQTTSARSVLGRLYPWIGKAVHARWRVRRSVYQQEAQDLLMAFGRVNGHVPQALALRLHGFLARLHGEWFPPDWRPDPTYAEILRDFHWWLDLAESWRDTRSERARKAATPRAKRRREPLAEQPARLLRLLALPAGCTQREFLAKWRRFLKENHPDLNPGQTAEERRRFQEAVALWQR